ncbi:hypothetical protein ACCS78_38395, partial [Rhizobium johnstonii]
MRMVLALPFALYSNEQKRGAEPLAFDEMITGDESPRPPYEKYFEWYNSQDRAHLIAKSRDAENIFRKTGITFAVYGHAISEISDKHQRFAFDGNGR